MKIWGKEKHRLAKMSSYGVHMERSIVRPMHTCKVLAPLKSSNVGDLI